MEEWIKKSDVLELLSLPYDIFAEYICEMKGVWVDEDWSERTPYVNEDTMIIPNDFQGKTIEKSWFDKDLAVVIYFDEEKWSIDYLQPWFNMISEFTDCPVMMLPKSFSELQYLEYDQLLLLKELTDKAISEMEQ